MQDRATFLRVGLLVVFGIAALIGLIVFFSGERIRSGQDFETYFSESVQGLEVGAPVKFRGVTLGRVTEISLVRSDYGTDVSEIGGAPAYALVLVRFRIDMSRLGFRAPVETAIRNGLRARLANQGITGVVYIELDFYPPTQYPPLAVPWHPRDTYVPSIPSTLTQVQDAAQQLLQKLNAVDLAGLVKGADGLIADLRGTLDHGDVHTLVANASETLRTIDDAVRAADLPAVAAQAQQTLKAADTAANGKQTQELIANANSAVAKLATAVAQLRPLIASLQATVQRADNGTADVQQSLTPVLRDLQLTLSNLRDTSAQLRRDPGQVLFGGPPPRDRGFAR